MSSLGDALLRKVLKGSPTTLLAALVVAALDDPVVVQSYPRASAARLGVNEGGRRAHVLGQAPGTSVAVGATIRMTAIGAATIGTVIPLGGWQRWEEGAWEALSGCWEARHDWHSVVFWC